MNPPEAPHNDPQPADAAPERLLALSLEEILPQLSHKLAAWDRTPEMVRYALHLIGTRADKETGLAVVHAKTFCRVTGRRHGHDILVSFARSATSPATGNTGRASSPSATAWRPGRRRCR